MEPKFPFAPVTDVQVVFGGIPNYDEVLAACPKEFRDFNPWSDLAEKIFFFGLREDAIRKIGIKATSQEEADMKWAYFRTWLGSFAPKHQDKVAVCGWLLSLMLAELPQYDPIL